MKKSIMMLAAVFSGSLALTAGPMETVFDGKGLGKSWRLNAWSGYKPYVSAAWKTADQALHFSKAQSVHGFGVCSSGSLPASAGDKVCITLDVKGSGSGWMGLQNFAGDKWTGVPAPISFPIPADWKKVTLEVPVTNIKEPTSKVMITFGGLKDAELFVRSIRAEVVKKAPGK